MSLVFAPSLSFSSLLRYYNGYGTYSYCRIYSVDVCYWYLFTQYSTMYHVVLYAGLVSSFVRTGGGGFYAECLFQCICC
jgi:hypothetical protein